VAYSFVQCECMGRDCWWFFGRPTILPHQLTDSHHWEILAYDLPKLQDDDLLAIIAWKWYMNEGVRPHFSHVEQDDLNNICHYHRLGRERPIAWPPLLPGHPEALVYVPPVNNKEALHYRTVVASKIIHSYPWIFEERQQSIMISFKAYWRAFCTLVINVIFQL
jgi:hypothetical protein